MSVVLIFTSILLIAYLFYGIASISRKGLEKQKEELMNLYSSTISDMNEDMKNPSVNPEIIRNISISIINFTRKVDQISSSIMQGMDKEWLTDVITGFNTELDLWISCHTRELSIIEAELANIEGISGSGKSSLDGVRFRLGRQINNFHIINPL